MPDIKEVNDTILELNNSAPGHDAVSISLVKEIMTSITAFDVHFFFFNGDWHHTL